ncbi:hypothetical protein [Hymenobacter cellulosilyticus]|uniref:Uncharacterized protein n=1 Tax=Hymenobacter cellulosilyticus TaxID=2932248 RepID=A0A8T9Q967_9BACT|nr:hypothetical protein [Hymenobacter cellulosilyticus]UOQ72658.1 hypothetical protein MUN79_01275 [Hymenobacter cellulosilyticus]
MKTNLLRLLVLFTAFLASCAKEANDTPAPTIAAKSESAMVQSSDDMMVLGRQLENPYTVDVMLKASNNLASRGYSTNVNIRTTHLYVRFLPKSTQEYYLMAKDDALDIYDHPLDYEIAQPGGTYHDPSIPSDQYSWQYCAVKVGYNFPAIQYEILAELYLPETDKAVADANSLDLLENEAMAITGNSDSGTEQRIASFTPGGRIQVRNVLQYRDFRDNSSRNVDQLIGLEGAQVRANRWFTTHRAITDVNGYYRMNDSFKNPCNYSIKWERPDFDILDRAIFGQATLDGPKKTGDWNTDITGGSQLFYATIHRGAWDYYYNDQMRNAFGLKKPQRGIISSNSAYRCWPRMKVLLLTETILAGAPRLDFPTSGFSALTVIPTKYILRRCMNWLTLRTRKTVAGHRSITWTM